MITIKKLSVDDLENKVVKMLIKMKKNKQKSREKNRLEALMREIQYATKE